MRVKFKGSSILGIASAVAIGTIIATIPRTGDGPSEALAQIRPELKIIRPLPMPMSLSTLRMTNFDPSRHGFKFINQFLNVTGIADITTGGLCAGMVYTALDYYKANRPIPGQTYLPVNGTNLQSNLYSRNMTALGDHIDKWIELHANPFGARNSEFFKWGLQGTGGGRLQELRAKIDAGEPVPLGLKSLSANAGEDHVVLAIGYDMGRYQGDLGANQTDLKIFLYEPNFGAQTITLVPKPDRDMWCYEQRNSRGQEVCWRTYFVQQNYRQRPLPNVPAGPQKEMRLEIATGGDDLRGGSDNANVSVFMRGGQVVRATNVNMGQRWMGNSFNTVGISLPATATPNDVERVQIETAFGGGMGGDNWTIDTVKMSFADNNVVREECTRNEAQQGAMRLTGAVRNASFNFPCRNQLHLFFRTGGDDLRGGSDNVGVSVRLRNGSSLDFPNVNRGVGWPGNSTRDVRLDLPAGFDVNSIASIRLKTSFGGGMGGDNWNLDAFHAHLIDGSRTVRSCRTGNMDGGTLLKRFTGSEQDRDFGFPC
jgi:hypothetical protein